MEALDGSRLWPPELVRRGNVRGRRKQDSMVCGALGCFRSHDLHEFHRDESHESHELHESHHFGFNFGQF